MSEELQDEDARTAICTDLDRTLFVNAGAGSGKTTALVSRVRTLVLDGGARMRDIATITFTEKAGAELRDRLRKDFEGAIREASAAGRGDQEQAARDALEDLDSAAIGTLHSFAQRILTEHPIEAGLPPAISLVDEVGSSVAFADRWAPLQRELLDDDGLSDVLILALALGVKLDNIRSLAEQLGRDWDLLDEYILQRPQPPLRTPDLTAFMVQASAVAGLMSECTNANDKLLAPFVALRGLIDDLKTTNDLASQVQVLMSIVGLKFTYGQKGNWRIPTDEVKAAGNELRELADKLRSDVLDQCLRHLTRWTAERVLGAAEQRRLHGTLEFQDLLVLTRDMLRRHPEVRASLQNKYRYLLLDEFQDTDPIQIELAVRIAGGAAAEQADWREVGVPDGRLFVVGDPKQSIYRFRRADIRTYFDAEKHIGEDVTLTSNFRTVAPVLNWVNHVFSHAIVEEKNTQPPYVPLAPARKGVPGGGPAAGPAVLLLGAEGHDDKPNASELRTREAEDVAAAIREALTDGWSVYDERSKEWRAAIAADIAILVPARTSLPFLEDALDAAGIPYRAEASSLVYQTPEVRDLLTCARAIADWSDELALVATLRSPLFGCGDDDLWAWRSAGHRFSLVGHHQTKQTVPGPVNEAFDYLVGATRAARWQSPSELLDAIITDRRMWEVGARQPRRRDTWRRLRFVVDQARAWAEATPGGLRSYLAWAAMQGQDTTRVAESVLPEKDVDAVRVMTVHAAKGLEFPIVILSGMSAERNNSRGVRVLWDHEQKTYQTRLSSSVATGDFAAALPVDEQMDDREKRRLLYVAATRARDHLVVSLHRNAAKNSPTAASILVGAGALDVGADRFERPDQWDPLVRTGDEPAPVIDHAAWIDQVRRARENSRVIPAISASGLEGTAPELVLAEPAPDEDEDARAGRAKGPRNLELPTWTKGRYGSAIGRAVHGVLQTVDLASSDGLESAVAAQAIAEGVTERVELIRSLAEAALGHELVQRAATREHWRETYVGTARDDGTVVEGYVDLIYREDDGSLVIVDYKTDAVPASALPSRVGYYRPQLDAYRDCLAAATGATVRTELLFLNPEGAVRETVS